MSDEKQESVSDYKSWLANLYDVTKLTDDQVYNLYIKTFPNEHMIISDSFLIHSKEINFELYHQSIAKEFYNKARNFRINFWVDENDVRGKSFIVSVQETTNEKPDKVQYLLDQWKFDNYTFKFKRFDITVLNHKLVLNWKIETKHGKDQLPLLSDAIKSYL
jgi:hypothetical protein